MSKLSRTKGHAWENLCCHALAQAGIRAKRNLTETREGNSGDLEVSNAPLEVQCKTGANPSVWRAVAEAVEVAEASGRFPVALIHRDARKPGEKSTEIAAMPLDWYIEMLTLLKGMGVW